MQQIAGGSLPSASGQSGSCKSTLRELPLTTSGPGILGIQHGLRGALEH